MFLTSRVILKKKELSVDGATSSFIWYESFCFMKSAGKRVWERTEMVFKPSTSVVREQAH